MMGSLQSYSLLGENRRLIAMQMMPSPLLTLWDGDFISMHLLVLNFSQLQGAIVTLTKGIALEVAEKGIRCNCIAPGPVCTIDFIFCISFLALFDICRQKSTTPARPASHWKIHTESVCISCIPFVCISTSASPPYIKTWGYHSLQVWTPLVVTSFDPEKVWDFWVLFWLPTSLN